MQIITDSHHTLPPLAATIGFFDGVHPGHKFLISQVQKMASQEGLCSAVITFPVHPRRVIQQDYCPQLLSSPEEKQALLSQTGIDYCLLLNFTRELSLYSAYDFMKLLHDKFHIQLLVIGYDHRFGHNRSESFEDYCRYGDELGIHIIKAEAYTNEGSKVSSSVIRRLLLEGEVNKAIHLLEHPFTLEGKVVGGRQVGRTLGFPTANLHPLCTDKLIPANGVYAIHAHVEGQMYGGMLNIGYRPTLNNGNDLSIEAHLFNFCGDLYNKQITLEFVAYLRPEIRFNGLDELKVQIEKDRNDSLRMLAL